jgi:hypothetical protein
LYVLKTGCALADIPRKYGSDDLLETYETVVKRRNAGTHLAGIAKLAERKGENRIGPSLSRLQPFAAKKRGGRNRENEAQERLQGDDRHRW